MDEYIWNEAWMSKEAAEKTVKAPKTVTDLQKLKVEKLMRKPDKPAYIPEPKKEWKPKNAPEFVRDVMGSSAGAGSGEFHVYRHIRRREFAREAYLDKMDKKQKLDDEYQEKLKAEKEKAEAVTAKKRSKRQRRKQKVKYLKQKLKKEKEAATKTDEKDSESDKQTDDEDEGEKEDDAEEQSFVMGGR